jgi:hypothetical protein
LILTLKTGPAVIEKLDANSEQAISAPRRDPAATVADFCTAVLKKLGIYGGA